MRVIRNSSAPIYLVASHFWQILISNSYIV